MGHDPVKRYTLEGQRNLAANSFQGSIAQEGHKRVYEYIPREPTKVKHGLLGRALQLTSRRGVRVRLPFSQQWNPVTATSAGRSGYKVSRLPTG
ncbi:hypothetical protein Agabi119p4_3757 [Agaricus bisporus var. burnettii]|uniref:Uncharacterized protein n=1 Tax=Agaricus bisporus var. burnettii TaxID=192524 RepID=A0A8H7KIF5_AGABI|nr:hypothetical protein Agabi119p4_3757 [Agaricus bisporus var. burnettii]